MGISHFINRHGIKHLKCAVCGVSTWLAQVRARQAGSRQVHVVVVEIIKYR